MEDKETMEDKASIHDVRDVILKDAVLMTEHIMARVMGREPILQEGHLDKDWNERIWKIIERALDKSMAIDTVQAGNFKQVLLLLKQGKLTPTEALKMAELFKVESEQKFRDSEVASQLMEMIDGIKKD